MSHSKELGGKGEKLAARYLRRNGYRIAQRNYTCALGEIDIVALRDDQLCFVEIKTRRSDRFLAPEVNVTPDKQRRIRRIARAYLTEKGIGEGDIDIRFDVIAVVLSDDGDPHIEHYEGAF